MKRSRSSGRGPRGERGAALLTVVMVMLVLGLLAAYLAESISGQYASGSLAQLVRQADHAAQSGLEWGKDRALRGGVCGAATLSFAGMSVDVSCTALQVNEGGVLYDVFAISTEARHGSYGNADFVRRTARGRYAAR